MDIKTYEKKKRYSLDLRFKTDLKYFKARAKSNQRNQSESIYLVPEETFEILIMQMKNILYFQFSSD